MTEQAPTEILLLPRGEPSLGAHWSDPLPHRIALAREDESNWYGCPLDNPACPELAYPKSAWELAPAAD